MFSFERGTMLGSIGSSIMGIFRLLSPDEIDKYLEYKEETSVLSSLPIAAGAEGTHYGDESPEFKNAPKKKKFPKEHQAKIIPLREVKSKDEEKSDLEKDIVGSGNIGKKSSSELESIGVLSARTILEIERAREKKENDKKDSATVFILQEREKLKKAQNLLQTQNALKSYQRNTAYEFHNETDEEAVSNDLKGVLLNKRLF